MYGWLAVAAALATWALTSMATPAEGRWRRAGVTLLGALFVGVTLWLVTFSAGAAVLIGAQIDLPLGPAATVAAAAGFALFCVATSLVGRGRA